MTNQYPQPYPQQQPYQPPPGFQVQPLPNKGHGFAVTSLVLGIIGLVFGFIPLTFFVALILGALALIFGLLGRRHGMGKAGVVLGIAALAFGIWGAVIVNKAVKDINKCSSSSTQTQINQNCG